MEESVTVNAAQFDQLLRDVASIKQQLRAVLEFGICGVDDEGELTDWAKKELAEARAIPDSENISLEALREEILAR